MVLTRIIIYGAGAIGSVIAGHLFRRDYEVVLVGNPEHIRAIKTHGLKLVTGEETFTLPIPVAERALELAPFHDDDRVLMCVKSQHTLQCLGQLKNASSPSTLPLFCCQNSIWNEPIATTVFDRVYGVMLYVDAIFLLPGEVINPVTEPYGYLEIGRYPRGSDPLCHEIADALSRSGFSVIATDNVMKSKGAKCLLNLSNALLVITGSRGNLSAVERELRREAVQVWASAGIEWEDFESFERRCRENSGKRKTPTGYEKLTKEMSNSSWQSLERRTGNIEAGQLNGDVSTLGRFLGIKTPYNDIVWEVAEKMARGRERPGKYTADEIVRMAQLDRNWTRK